VAIVRPVSRTFRNIVLVFGIKEGYGLKAFAEAFNKPYLIMYFYLCIT
jgi:hypothetical protein